MRAEYAAQTARLLPPGGHVLLITMEYPSGTLDGPPFSVIQAEVQALYGGAFDVVAKGTWKGQGHRGVSVAEKVYTLTRREGPEPRGAPAQGARR